MEGRGGAAAAHALVVMHVGSGTGVTYLYLQVSDGWGAFPIPNCRSPYLDLLAR